MLKIPAVIKLLKNIFRLRERASLVVVVSDVSREVMSPAMSLFLFI